MEDKNNSIIIFNYLYEPFYEYKDTGQYIIGLKEIGVDVLLITVKKKNLENYQPNFKIIKEEADKLLSFNYWQRQPVKNIIYIAYKTSFDKKIIRILKKAGKKIIFKLDSDGALLPPIYNIKSQRFKAEVLKIIPRLIKWYLPPFNKINALNFINTLNLADSLIIESPQAAENLKKSLIYWNRKEVIKKINIIPNPVQTENLFEIEKIKNKENIITAVGRWDDIKQKNTIKAMKTISEFTNLKKDFKAYIIGSGEKITKKLIKYNKTENIEILGPLPHHKVIEVLSKTKLFFMPSRWEGFPIAAAEAVTMGCSIVGTPIPALQYLSQNGFSGTISKDFSIKSLLEALIKDSEKWVAKKYKAEQIALYWRKKLNRKTIALKILKIIKNEKNL